MSAIPPNSIIRCEWAKGSALIPYHDQEWGVPQHDDRVLFEYLILEGAQAGLSWEAILRKRPTYRVVFDNFDPKLVAEYNEDKITQLVNHPGIIRNYLKITSAVSNAQAFLKVQQEFDSFDTYIWQFVKGKPIKNKNQTLKQIPTQTYISVQMSKDLERRGFKFVGPTICYSFMQAVGMVNDHLVSCFRYNEVG
jgi:DNA-3-methyladenine glycosylase I